jgi:hypothetical protein
MALAPCLGALCGVHTQSEVALLSANCCAMCACDANISQFCVCVHCIMHKTRCFAIVLTLAFSTVIFRMLHIQQSARFLLQRIEFPSSRYAAPKRYAVVSLLTPSDAQGGNMRYQQGLCKLGTAIDRFASIERVLMLLASATPLDLCGWTPHQVLPLDGPEKHADAHTNTYLAAHVYTKLRAWELTQYAAVLFLDLDTLVVGQFSPLFEVHLPHMLARGQAVAMGRNTHPDGLDYNSGVILLVPDLSVFAALVQGINHIPHSIDTADQALLNAFFTPQSVYLLPFQFNAMVSEKVLHPGMWANATPMLILHYTCKPWNTLNCWNDNIQDLCLLWHLYP